jgi:hypothetical protein
MKRSMRTIFVLLAAVLSLVAVHAVWAETLTVEGGTVERIGSGSIDVASNGTTYTFYHIPLSDLPFVLIVGDTVTISAYDVIFPNGTSKYIAYSIEKDSVTYTWHPNVPKPGANKGGTDTVTLTATDENGQPCYCNCVENTVCLECNCYCDAMNP